MVRLPFQFLLVVLFAFSGQSLRADIVVFDFGNGDHASNSQGGGTGNWDPFPAGDAKTLLSAGSVSATLLGLRMTMSGSTTDGNSTDDETWGITKEGIGIHTDGAANANSRRLDGAEGESITFNFDKDVELISIRIGSAGGGDTVTITPAGDSTISVVSANEGPSNDFFLDSNGDGTGSLTFVVAGTDIVFTTTSGDVLFNEFTVSTTAVPEPASLYFLCSVALLGLRRRRTR